MSPIRETNRISKSELDTLLVQSKRDSLFKCDFQCSIDAKHVIDIANLETHMQNCQRRNAHLGRVKCRYHGLHFTSIENIKQHEEECPDRKVNDGKISGEIDDKQNAKMQIAELKLQCGLPMSQEEMELCKNMDKC